MQSKLRGTRGWIKSHMEAGTQDGSGMWMARGCRASAEWVFRKMNGSRVEAKFLFLQNCERCADRWWIFGVAGVAGAIRWLKVIFVVFFSSLWVEECGQEIELAASKQPLRNFVVYTRNIIEEQPSFVDASHVFHFLFMLVPSTSHFTMMMLRNGSRCMSKTQQHRALTTSRNERLLTDFGRMLPKEAILQDRAQVDGHRQDWLKHIDAPWIDGETTSFVLRPDSVEHVSEILRYCNRERVSVIPQGGNTGLVHGSTPVNGDEVVLSMSRMNRILNFDAINGVIVCESGCILDDLNAHANKFKHIMPIDLGSSGSCQIGGNISTNAGGIRLLRYGSLRASVLGLEVVLANGEVLDLLSSLRKDNTGYDLKQLFIGGEGTLGVITKAAISTPPAPNASNVALLGLPNFDAVVSALTSARTMLGEVLSALEFWDDKSMALVLEQLPALAPSNPLGPSHHSPFYLLVESSGSNGSHDEEKMMAFLETYSDGVLAMDESKQKHIWAIRENIAVALKHKGGYTYKYDVSMPTNLFQVATDTVADRLKSYPVEVMQYGHVGDGNLHLNVWSPSYDAEIKTHIEDSLYNFLQENRGSISAEHGIGTLKASKLHYSKSPLAITTMKQVKQLFDPNNILNPGRVIG